MYDRLGTKLGLQGSDFDGNSEFWFVLVGLVKVSDFRVFALLRIKLMIVVSHASFDAIFGIYVKLCVTQGFSGLVQHLWPSLRPDPVSVQKFRFFSRNSDRSDRSDPKFGFAINL